MAALCLRAPRGHVQILKMSLAVYSRVDRKNLEIFSPARSGMEAGQAFKIESKIFHRVERVPFFRLYSRQFFGKKFWLQLFFFKISQIPGTFFGNGVTKYCREFGKRRYNIYCMKGGIEVLKKSFGLLTPEIDNRDIGFYLAGTYLAGTNFRYSRKLHFPP